MANKYLIKKNCFFLVWFFALYCVKTKQEEIIGDHSSSSPDEFSKENANLNSKSCFERSRCCFHFPLPPVRTSEIVIVTIVPRCYTTASPRCRPRKFLHICAFPLPIHTHISLEFHAIVISTQHNR